MATQTIRLAPTPKGECKPLAEGETHYKYVAYDKMEGRKTGMVVATDIHHAESAAYRDMYDRGFCFVEDMHVEPLLL